MEFLCYRFYFFLEILMVVVDFNKGIDNYIFFILFLYYIFDLRVDFLLSF